MNKKLKVLNLYAGIGGNRKLWNDNEVQITAVEHNPEIAKIYQDFFPNDKVIVGDAHQYLLEHYKEFDFIWSSPPCPTHSRILTLKNAQGMELKYPDMKLYEEIIFLTKWFKGKFCVENVRSYYDPLIKPQEIGRHFYWANFHISLKEERNQIVRNGKEVGKLDVKMNRIGIKVGNFYNYKGDKRQLINNCVEPKTGLDIFNCAFKESQVTLE